jgi:hypothetical protein
MGGADEHIVETEKRQSVLWRDSNYRSNTSSGWTSGSWEAHHILCNHAVEGRVIEKNPEFVEACLWITPWDLNDAHNMIGLPKNLQYKVTDGKVPANLPSHQVDHNTTGGYTDECKEHLKTKIWNVLNDKRKNHKTNAENIKAKLRAGSDRFRALLLKRGSREGGTAHCWSHRFDEPQAGASAAERRAYRKEEKWYYPFSMAADKAVNERHPGVDWRRLANILRKIT